MRNILHVQTNILLVPHYIVMGLNNINNNNNNNNAMSKAIGMWIKNQRKMRPLRGVAEPLICVTPPRKSNKEPRIMSPTKDNSPSHPTKNYPASTMKDNPQATKWPK